MSIKNFTDWQSLNESGVTPEQLEKVFADVEKWSKDTGIEIQIEKNQYDLDFNYIYVKNLFGMWKLSLERSARKSGQDSFYRQTYEKGENMKWYITWPGRFSQYNSRGRTKPGNLKTFKALAEEFTEVKKVFEKISFFLEEILGIPGIDTTHYTNSEGKKSVTVDGRDLKSLRAFGAGVMYNRSADTGKIHSMHAKPAGWNADPTKVEILHKSLNQMGSNGVLANKEALEESGKEIEDVLSVLEALKDLPLDTFLKDAKALGWEGLLKKYSGRLSGKKFGL